MVRLSTGTLWEFYSIRYQNLYRAGFTIALAIHSFDPIPSLDLI